MEQYDIVARIQVLNGERVSGDKLFGVVQRILADRFRLNVHKEKKPETTYALVLARQDRRLGPSFHESTVDCGSPTSRCGGTVSGAGRLHGEAATMQNLVMALSPHVGRLVVDETGLNGRFDVDLSWEPENAGGSVAQPGAAASIFTALQEQLGLKLEPRKDTIDVLVIDHVERPSED